MRIYFNKIFGEILGFADVIYKLPFSDVFFVFGMFEVDHNDIPISVSKIGLLSDHLRLIKYFSGTPRPS